MDQEKTGDSLSVKCKFCLDEINAGASHCASCGRKQPRPALSRQAKVAWTMGIALLACVLLVVFVIAQSMYRDPKVSKLARCAQSHGNTEITEQFLQKKLRELTESGADWDLAYGQIAAILGCR